MYKLRVITPGEDYCGEKSNSLRPPTKVYDWIRKDLRFVSSLDKSNILDKLLTKHRITLL